MTRRTVLQAGAAVLGGEVTAAEVPGGQIDTHTHFYDPTRPQGVPWPSRTDNFLYRKVMPEEFRELARALGVTSTVVVEASSWLEDNQWLLDLADHEPVIAGIVGHLTPGDPGFGAALRRFAKHRRFRGIRIGGDGLAARLEQPAYLEDLRRLTDHGLTLDVNGGPGMLPEVAQLGRKLPQLTVVVNHVANVRIDGGPASPDWVRGIRAAAETPNVFCKVSALVEGTGRDQAPAEVAFYRPVLDTVWEAFGPDRLVYGSNWPVSARYASYTVVHRIVAEYFQVRGEAAARKYFRENARRAYRLP
jgi:predicted TIM-barrel fold metal-dependent hydrolase